MADDDVHRIKVRAGTVEELRAFLDDSDMDFGCRPVAAARAAGSSPSLRHASASGAAPARGLR